MVVRVFRMRSVGACLLKRVPDLIAPEIKWAPRRELNVRRAVFLVGPEVRVAVGRMKPAYFNVLNLSLIRFIARSTSPRSTAFHSGRDSVPSRSCAAVYPEGARSSA